MYNVYTLHCTIWRHADGALGDAPITADPLWQPHHYHGDEAICGGAAITQLAVIVPTSAAHTRICQYSTSVAPTSGNAHHVVQAHHWHRGGALYVAAFDDTIQSPTIAVTTKAADSCVCQ